MVFRIQTNLGQLTIPLVMPDSGDIASNEHAGVMQLKALLVEASRAIGAHSEFLKAAGRVDWASDDDDGVALVES